MGVVALIGRKDARDEVLNRAVDADGRDVELRQRRHHQQPAGVKICPDRRLLPLEAVLEFFSLIAPTLSTIPMVCTNSLHAEL